MPEIRLPELLLVQDDLVEADRPVTVVYEVDRANRTARMLGVHAKKKDKVIFSHTVQYYPLFPTEDREVLSDLFHGCMSGGLE